MNTSMLVLSIRYIKTNFKEIVKLSKWINNYFVIDRYNDNKFINSLKKEDEIISNYLSDMVMHKRNIIETCYYRTCFKPPQGNFVSSDNIDIFLKLSKGIYNHDCYDDHFKYFATIRDIYNTYMNKHCDVETFINKLSKYEVKNLVYYLYSFHNHESIETIKLFIKGGADIYSFVSIWSYELIKFVLDGGYCTNSNKKIIFTYCIRNEKFDIVELLLKYDFNITSFLMDKRNSLYGSILGNNKILDFLIEKDIRIKSCSHVMIRRACSGGYDKFLIYIRSKYDIDFNYKREEIIKKLKGYSLKIIRTLYDCGFNFSFDDDIVLKTYLVSNRHNIFKYLVNEAKVKINNFNTLLKQAIDLDRKHIIKILTKQYKDLNSEILLKCIEKSEFTLVSALLRQGIRHPHAYHTAMGLGRTRIGKLIRKYEIFIY